MGMHHCNLSKQTPGRLCCACGMHSRPYACMVSVGGVPRKLHPNQSVYRHPLCLATAVKAEFLNWVSRCLMTTVLSRNHTRNHNRLPSQQFFGRLPGGENVHLQYWIQKKGEYGIGHFISLF